MVGEEARAPLDGQLIEREMLACEREGAAELAQPRFERLARPGIDQVEGLAIEMTARGIGEDLEYHVARSVPVLVIDLLEEVEIHQQQRQR